MRPGHGCDGQGTVRLTEHEASAIRQAVSANFGEDAEVRLFGSRADDSKRGGDIDLFIETDIEDTHEIFQRELKLLSALYLKIGEQKIDLVVKSRGRKTELPIYRVAREFGVRL